MEAKEKSKELLQRFIKVSQHEDFEAIYVAKKCALIAVEEILEWERINFGTNTKATDYWQQVKAEIEKM